jgi:tripartite-type tricarboxylate transporter receptor subunit TctC
MKDFVSDTWNAISAPPKTPAAVIAKLNAALNDALKSPELRAQFEHMGLLPGGGAPAEMGSLVKSETQRWGDVIRKANVTLQQQ